jgi:hypothetical protein
LALGPIETLIVIAVELFENLQGLLRGRAAEPTRTWSNARRRKISAGWRPVELLRKRATSETQQSDRQSSFHSVRNLKHRR